jgi:hypothetical protein
MATEFKLFTANDFGSNCSRYQCLKFGLNSEDGSSSPFARIATSHFLEHSWSSTMALASDPGVAGTARFPMGSAT